jgi:hypothetical protein
MNNLLEDKRTELISRGKRGEREKGDGKTRYEKRVKSSFSTSTRSFNNINMNQLFKDNILTVGIEIHGETNDYKVTIKFGGFLDTLKEILKRQNNKLDLRAIIRALMESFNKQDVYIRCSCEDFFYRFGYFATVDKIIEGEPQLIPSDITNPRNTLGPGCKHIMLVLSNTGWIIKVASVVMNYIKYFEQHRQKQYADIIYPAIYGKKYEEPVQLSFDDKDELDSEKEIIDKSNEEGKKRGQFKSGNEYRFKPQDKPNPNQLSIEDEV